MQVHGQAMHPAAPSRLTTRRTRPGGLSRRDDQAEMAVIHGAHYRLLSCPAAGCALLRQPLASRGRSRAGALWLTILMAAPSSSLLAVITSPIRDTHTAAR